MLKTPLYNQKTGDWNPTVAGKIRRGTVDEISSLQFSWVMHLKGPPTNCKIWQTTLSLVYVHCKVTTKPCITNEGRGFLKTQTFAKNETSQVRYWLICTIGNRRFFWSTTGARTSYSGSLGKFWPPKYLGAVHTLISVLSVFGLALRHSN